MLQHFADGTDKLSYMHGDHLGSTSLTTDYAGNEVSSGRYYPYGRERSVLGNSPTDFGFTSQRNEASFGLMDYNARYYSPILGRFVSPDSIVPEPSSSGGYNRYRYARNSPLMYTDPTGHYTVDPDTRECFGGDCDHYMGYRDFDENTLFGNKRKLYNYGMSIMGVANNDGKRFSAFLHYGASLYSSTAEFVYDVAEMLHNHKLKDMNWGSFMYAYYNDAIPKSDYFLGHNVFDQNCPNGDTCGQGWQDIYRDRTGNQAHHFWFYVAVSYAYGGATSFSGNFMHDGREVVPDMFLAGSYNPLNLFLDNPENGLSEQDYYLGVVGVKLGNRIRAGVSYSDPNNMDIHLHRELTPAEIATAVDMMVLDLE